MKLEIRRGPIPPYFAEDENGLSIMLNGCSMPSVTKLKEIQELLQRIINKGQKKIDSYNSKLENKIKQMEENVDYTTKPKTPQKGYVYIYKSGEYCKIGRAKNIETRRKVYRTENPHPIEIVAEKFVNNYIDAENQLHETFKNKRFRGEWFKITNQEALKAINSI